MPIVTTHRLTVFCLLLTVHCTLGANKAPMITLATPGSKIVDFRVILEGEPTPDETYAASELATYLGRLTDTTVAVVESGATAGKGWTFRLRNDPAMTNEVCHLQVKRALREVIITGGRPRGVLYGVYALLADHFGCRWYTPDVEQVPTGKPLQLPGNLNQTIRPVLEYRNTDWYEAQDPVWAARNRLNAVSSLQPQQGGHIIVNPFVHSFNSILDPEKEFDAHPDYFSMVNGKRIKDKTQLCLSNPDVLKKAIEKAREWAKAGGDHCIVSVSQNDCENPCECPACKAIDEPEDCHSAALITFVNKIGEAIETEFPTVSIDTLAYLYSRKPPKTIKPRKNVIVRLCSIEACFSHPLDGCPEKSNTSFMDDIRGWNKLTKRLYIWDYTCNYNHYMMPFPNLDVLDENIRTFVSNGVVGIFEEGAAPMGEEWGGLKSWVLAQLLWNPKLNDQKLENEYIAHVYGPAAGKVREFIDIQRVAAHSDTNHARVFDGPKGTFLADDVLRKCDTTLDAAEKIAKTSNDEALIKRIATLRMSIWYTRYTLGHEPSDVLKDQARHFVETGRALHYTNVDAWTPGFDDFAAKLEATYK